MSRTILIAEDKDTVGYTDVFDYIYDEYSNFDELLEGIGVYLIPCATAWEIGIATPELFSKFKEDFAKIGNVFPLLKEFKDVNLIYYYSHFFWEDYITKHPSEKDMMKLERHMKKDNEEWIKHQKEEATGNQQQ